MGYETKLIVGEVSEYEKGCKWISISGILDLCKCGDSELHKLDWQNKTGKAKVYWYGLDGNTRFIKDSYDDMPNPLPINDVIEALVKDSKKDSYRRFKWALGMLKAIKDNSGEGQSVLLIGH